jgi:hypothetical protein
VPVQFSTAACISHPKAAAADATHARIELYKPIDVFIRRFYAKHSHQHGVSLQLSTCSDTAAAAVQLLLLLLLVLLLLAGFCSQHISTSQQLAAATAVTATEASVTY